MYHAILALFLCLFTYDLQKVGDYWSNYTLKLDALNLLIKYLLKHMYMPRYDNAISLSFKPLECHYDTI